MLVETTYSVSCYKYNEKDIIILWVNFYAKKYDFCVIKKWLHKIIKLGIKFIYLQTLGVLHVKITNIIFDENCYFLNENLICLLSQSIDLRTLVININLSAFLIFKIWHKYNKY